MELRSKVGFKLQGVNFLSLLVALVGLLLVMQYLATRQILAWHRQRVELVARLVLAEYQGKIERVVQAANLLADNPTYGELLASGNPEALRSLVLPTMQATGLHVLTITDDKGVIKARAQDPEAIGVNISSNPIVRAGLQGKLASRMTQWQNNVALSAAAPTHYQDRIVGVMLTGLLVDRRFVESLSRPGAEVAIFFANRLVVNSFKDLPENALAELRRVKDRAARSPGPQEQVQNLQLGGHEYTLTFLPLEQEEKPWENLLVVGVNRRELGLTLSTLKLVIFGVGAASPLVGALLSVWLSWGMRRQINHLTEGTRQAATEELAGDIPVTSNDELGELAVSFNTMTRALREKTNLLKAERDRVAANADFLAMIVHDIKAPLTGVRLTIEALEDETLPPEINHKLQGIIQRSEGLLLHLHNVLDLSRFEAGSLVLRPEAVPPGFVIHRLVNHFGPVAQHQRVTLTAALAPDLPAMRVDEHSLERVLSNLLVNALAATPEGGEIQVGARIPPGGDHQEVEIFVADTGCGLKPEQQEHLFEKYRLRPQKIGSSGLGLYICKTLVEANHGRIWVDSTLGRGSRVFLAFPTSRTGEETKEREEEKALAS
ncbi:MAG: HAMP domain-containing sensor histidine kinase [Syntrophales bacterium]|nr:HAMP domain-containing sensor histidine kinase [Syntrophales bacterium]